MADRITFIHSDWVSWTRDYLKRKEKGEVKKEDEIEVVFLSPPWGGISYQTLGTSTTTETPAAKKRRISSIATDELPHTPTPVVPNSHDSPPPAYPLSALAPLHGAELFSLAAQVTPHIAYYLPRNVDLLEVAQLSPLKPGEAEKRERVEVEEEWMSGKLKAVTAYFGGLVVGSTSGDSGAIDEEDEEDLGE